MVKTRPPNPAAFREQIIELFRSSGSQSELAREFSITPATIANWVARAAADAGKPVAGKDVLTSAEREELVRLRRENRRLQTERDILANSPRATRLPRWHRNTGALHCHTAPHRGRKSFGGSQAREQTWPKANSGPKCGGTSCDPG